MLEVWVILLMVCCLLLCPILAGGMNMERRCIMFRKIEFDTVKLRTGHEVECKYEYYSERVRGKDVWFVYEREKGSGKPVKKIKNKHGRVVRHTTDPEKLPEYDVPSYYNPSWLGYHHYTHYWQTQVPTDEATDYTYSPLPRGYHIKRVGKTFTLYRDRRSFIPFPLSTGPTYEFSPSACKRTFFLPLPFLTKKCLLSGLSFKEEAVMYAWKDVIGFRLGVCSIGGAPWRGQRQRGYWQSYWKNLSQITWQHVKIELPYWKRQMAASKGGRILNGLIWWSGLIGLILMFMAICNWLFNSS